MADAEQIYDGDDLQGADLEAEGGVEDMAAVRPAQRPPMPPLLPLLLPCWPLCER